MMASAGGGAKWGVAFCEASGDPNNEKMPGEAAMLCFWNKVPMLVLVMVVVTMVVAMTMMVVVVAATVMMMT